MDQFIERFLRVFDGPTSSFIYEDPDELGYTLIKSESITPSIFRGTPASQETKEILCEIMPADEWLEIERKARNER